jgi:hypothetical protein
MMRRDVVTVTSHCDAILLCHVTIDNPAYYGNVYDQTERYPMSLPFHTSEWDDERELCTRTLGDDVNIRRGGGGTSSREMNRDNEDIQGSHSWQGSTSTESTLRAWNPWPFYDNL